jgi:tetratricopeptide (TPR) repeat protein
MNSPPTFEHSPAARGRPDWPVLAAGALLAAAAAAAYSGTFSVPPLLDDDASIADNPTIRHLGTALWPPGFATVGGRPVLNVSLAINYAISGTEVWSYHALNLAIHILAGLTLFGVVRRTLAPRKGPEALLVALSAALLWILHPLQTESVTYLIQRAESLMGLFYLLTLYLFIRGAESGRVRGGVWFTLSMAACLLGMGSKEVMVSAPLVVFLYDRTFLAGSFSEAWRRRRWVHVGLAATWVIVPFLVLSTHGRGGTAGYGSGVSWWAYAMTQLPAIVHYLRLCLWPHPLVFDYGTALTAPSLKLLPYALAVTGLVAATGWALVRRPAVGFLGACFFAILAPSSSIVPVATETMAEHRMYLPLIPVVLLVVMGIYRWLGRAALPFSLVLAAGLSWATWQRNGTYRSEEGIWTDTVAKCPENERARNNLGNALDAEGRVGEAIIQREEVLRLKPDSAEAHSNMGNSLAKVPGRLDEAIAQYAVAVRLKPDYEAARNNLGNALEGAGRTAEAIEQLEAAVRLRPDLAEAHSNLGNSLAKVPGRRDEAIAQYEEAVRLKPDYAEAHNNLGNALDAAGRTAEAIAQCEEAVRLRPNFAHARNNLGNALAKTPGRRDEAIGQFEEAVRLEPDFAEAHNNLGNALDAAGRTAEAIAQCEEAVRLRPGFAEAHSNLGNVLARSPGRLGEAIAQYEEAIRLRPGYPTAHNNLASVLSAAGRTSEAVVQYEEALRLKPDSAAIHVNLAIALLKIPGRSDEAVAHLNEALRLQPGNAAARQILARVGGPGR